MSLWTPDGERPVSREPAPAGGPGGAAAPGAGPSDDPLTAAAAAMGIDLASLTEDEKLQLQGELTEMMRVRREVSATPVGEMLANHQMRLFDLATIYLEADPPAFAEAATVIEAFRAVLDGVGDRLGDQQALLAEALGQLQMIFVQVKRQTEGTAPA